MLIDVLLLAEIIRAGRAHWGGRVRTGVGPIFDSCRRLKFACHRGSRHLASTQIPMANAPTAHWCRDFICALWFMDDLHARIEGGVTPTRVHTLIRATLPYIHATHD